MTVTAYFMLIVGLVVAVFDVSCMLGILPFETISQTIRAWGRRWPWLRLVYIVLAVFLFWHFFVRQP
jgi:hypothetical protein